MLDEVKNIARFIQTDRKMIALRNKILLILAAFLVLLIANRFLLINLADKKDFYISLSRSSLVFSSKTSIYRATIPTDSTELARIGIKELGDVPVFWLPLFSLIFYLPFTLIKDINWSLALWMTANQVLCYFTLNLMLKILDLKVKELYQYLAAILILFTYFIAGNVFQTNLSLIQIFLITTALYELKNRKFILSGILLGLAACNPFQFFIPLVIIFILNSRKKRGLINTWMIISFLLLSLLYVIFDMNWILELFKVLILKPTIYPFISYREYLAGVFPSLHTSLVEIIPIIVYMWIVIEWLRMPKENFIQELWLICLAFTLTPLLNMWDSPYTTAAYLPVFIYTISLWYERSSQKFRIFSISLYGIILIAMPVLRMILSKNSLPLSETYPFNGIVTVILMLNLYWVRLWVVNPYYSVNKLGDL